MRTPPEADRIAKSVDRSLSRRDALAAGAAGLGAVLWATIPAAAAAETVPARPAGLDFEPLDLHVHLDNSTIDKVLEIAEQRQVKFGIVEHAGTEENKYPVVLSSDEELASYLGMLKGKPVYRGVQAEWTDWSSCFTPTLLSQLDYALMDVMTYPGKDGQRVKLWEKDVAQRVEMDDKQAFMDRYVDFHVELIDNQPMDILGNASWLPAPLAPDYDTFWTPARVCRVVEAAARRQVAVEISSSLKLPKLPFLKLAKTAGVKFSFGSNGRYPNMGKLDYCFEMAKALGLGKADMFVPAAKPRQPVRM